MSHPAGVRVKLSLVVFLLFALACDVASLVPFGAPTSTPVPTLRIPLPVVPSTPSASGPSAAGWIAFVNAGNVWLMHPDGSGLKQVSKNPPSTDPARSAIRVRWSSDGQKLAFSQDGHIDVLDMATLGISTVAVNTAGGFDWAPYGYQIVYDGGFTLGQQGAVADSNSGLSVVDVQSKRDLPLVKSTKRYPAMLAPLWSFDASRVLFSDPDGAKPGTSHVLDISTGKIEDLTLPGSEPVKCNWAPNALTIACIMVDPQNPQGFILGLLPASGGNRRDLPVPARVLHPQIGPWSSDGSQVVIDYSNDLAGSQPMIGIISLDSGQFRTLGSGRASGWSPDGRWILAESPTDSGAPGPLLAINTTSGESIPLSEGSSAVWQPGERFTSNQPSQPGAGTPVTFCMDTSIVFSHQTKGYYFYICSGSQHYQIGPLSKGGYVVGPGGKFFVYGSSSGLIYAARVGDLTLTQIGSVRDFIIVRNQGDPLYDFRFIGKGPYSVQVTELNYREKVIFTIPPRITEP